MTNQELDPAKYEVFVERLRSLLEEGRTAITMVSGSPAVVEGGESMTSLYDGKGKAILTATGTVFHVTGSGEAVRLTLEYYREQGISQGDQFYYGDPYIAGTHLMDQIMVKPIFSEGRCVAWVGTMTHTGDTGGLLRGISTEIYHEGVRIRGMKLVEANKVRHDLVRVIAEQCRDPDYVTLDIMARIASGNVIEKGFLEMVEKFGVEFVEAAMWKLRSDTEQMVRKRLRGLVDGTWRQRIYWSNTERVGGKEKINPFKVTCTMTKKGDTLKFDFTGSSPQNHDCRNATLCGSRAQFFVAIAGFLCWDIPWNAGLVEMVDYIAPEGTVINCRFPASCSLATQIGTMAFEAAMGCIARMLYASGKAEYVNSSWCTNQGGGPSYWFGGHNQHGGIITASPYDVFAGGNGATPFRDGVDTGGVAMNARSATMDVEWVESYYPFLYLSSRHCTDSGGFGKFRGGMTREYLHLVYGTKDCSVDYLPTTKGGEIRSHGLFGGYPAGAALGSSLLLFTSKDFRERLSKGTYPTRFDELGPPWGVVETKKRGFHPDRILGGIRINVEEWDLLGYQVGIGTGYGDPLDRDPERVLADVKNEAIYPETVAKVYGVVIDFETMAIDLERTRQRREEIRQERLSKGERLTPAKAIMKIVPSRKKSLMRIHEYLEIVEKDTGEKVISCVKCGNEFCTPEDNYKKYALRWKRNLSELKQVLENEPILEYYQEYICPGCGTLLQVDACCPQLDTDEPFWDIDIRI